MKQEQQDTHERGYHNELPFALTLVGEIAKGRAWNSEVPQYWLVIAIDQHFCDGSVMLTGLNFSKGEVEDFPIPSDCVKWT